MGALAPRNGTSCRGGHLGLRHETESAATVRTHDPRAEFTLEAMLVLITLALACVLHAVEQSQVVVLNLFVLPVVLAAFFLGSYRAGVLALLSVVAATVVIMCDISRFSFVQTPVSIALGIIVWGAVLGLTAILVGTLRDERNGQFQFQAANGAPLQDVLERYLSSSDPVANCVSRRRRQLAMTVAKRLPFSAQQIDQLDKALLWADLVSVGQSDPLLPVQRTPAEPWDSALLAGFPGLNGCQVSLEAIGKAPLQLLGTIQRYLDLSGDLHATGSPAEGVFAKLRQELTAGEHDPAVLYLLEEIVREEQDPPLRVIYEETAELQPATC
ncbi:hypothetical protein [Planctomicrobium piriforme]|uniref:Uncharacterized protein n=1 Tax=Planctomicrobium piriforme TaxID=1576369 RepID=A0A1I3B3E2_9PLAN|nr:hypothetical protein [Planctomicrobium piriforme]SFH56606.1 hypothetical protein SAMN05421753_101199 [Planctomicrobium piriforme]